MGTTANYIFDESSSTLATPSLTSQENPFPALGTMPAAIPASTIPLPKRERENRRFGFAVVGAAVGARGGGT